MNYLPMVDDHGHFRFHSKLEVIMERSLDLRTPSAPWKASIFFNLLRIVTYISKHVILSSVTLSRFTFRKTNGIIGIRKRAASEMYFIYTNWYT